MTIVIVDDSPTNLKLLKAQLEAEGVGVLVASNGQEALKLLAHTSADAIISDVLMPKMDGYELCAKVRKEKKFDPIVFVFYSATYTSPGDEQFALDLGADGFFKKPCPVDAMLDCIKSHREAIPQPRQRTSISEESILREYSDRLVAKLEETNIELSQRTEELEREIAERKHAEEQRHELELQLFQAQKLESLGTLASGIAHDFNNILGIIMAHSTLVERGKSSPADFAESIKSITRAAQRGASLVKQLLTFARKADVVLESVRLNETVQEVVKLLNQTLPKTINIETQLAKSLPSVTADGTQMHQVLLNLCVNARDAMPRGGRLSIETAVVSGDTVRTKIRGANTFDYVQVRVKDTGTGMDEETKARIFEPFFTTKELGKGTGLGLATVFGIVQTHKGFIDVESQIGKGTSFSVYLPVQQRSLETEELKSETIEQIKGGTETVLLIEDEEDLLKTSTVILHSKGYHVINARDGLEGIKVYVENNENVSLVICDLGLPKLDGSVVFESLKGINPHVRFILASGFVHPEMKSELFKSGVKEFIQKPYMPDVLLRKVREVLEAKSS